MSCDHRYLVKQRVPERERERERETRADDPESLKKLG